MNDKSSSERSLKQKALHELRELVGLSLYLAFFFCAVATYRMLLLSEYNVKSFNFAFALINALVVAKVIMIGEYAKVGRRYESRPLLVSAIWKAFLFTLLMLGFHIVEDLIKSLIHGKGISGAYHELATAEVLGQCLIVFSNFIPLFGFRELRRVLGEEKFRALILGSKEGRKSELPT
jgi:hypothetical protein